MFVLDHTDHLCRQETVEKRKRKRKEERWVDVSCHIYMLVCLDSLYNPLLNLNVHCFRKRIQSTSKYIVRTLFEEGIDSDVTIQTLGKKWKLHKLYLSQVCFALHCCLNNYELAVVRPACFLYCTWLISF